MTKKTIPLTIAIIALVTAVETRATPYDLSFIGGGVTATGQIDVNGGIADSGYLSVDGGPVLNLFTWVGGGVNSVRVDGGTDLIVDDLVNPGANPALTIYGLAFVSSTMTGGYPSEGIDLSLDYGTAINLAGFGVNGYAVPNTDGTLTLTPAGVPDNASTLGLFGLSILGAFGFGARKKIVLHSPGSRAAAAT